MRRIFLVSLITLACGAESLDVGDTDAGVTGGTGGANATGGAGGSGPLGSPLPTWPATSDCVPSSNLELVGTWEGALRDFSFQTLVPLHLEILGASEQGGVCGTLRWGEGPPPEAITDPERGWPDDARLGIGGAAAFLREGTTYTILQGGVSDNEVHFSISSAELWKEWCSLQTPHYHPSSGNYECLPSYTSLTYFESEGTCELDQASGPSISIDYGLCGICFSQICVCNRDGCGANSEHGYPSPGFAITFEGTSASGDLADAQVADPQTTDIVLHRVE